MTQSRTASNRQAANSKMPKGSSMAKGSSVAKGFSAVNTNAPLNRRQRLSPWLRHHRRECREALQKLKRRPLQTTMLVCLIAVSLSFPFFFGWLVQSFQATGLTQPVKEPTLSVYLHSRASPSAIEDLRKRLDLRPDVARVTFISADQGLEELKAATGFSDVLSSMTRNPLPAVLDVRWQSTQANPMQRVPKARALQQFLQQQPIVASVSLDTLWFDRLRALERLGERFTLVLGTLFCVGVVLAIFNGVQLMIEQHRSDIHIAQKVGASASFVRRPFLYVGGLLGLMGGVLTITLLCAVFAYLNDALAPLLSAYGFVEYPLQDFPLSWCFSLMLLAVMLGWLGARIAVDKALRQPSV